MSEGRSFCIVLSNGADWFKQKTEAEMYSDNIAEPWQQSGVTY